MIQNRQKSVAIKASKISPETHTFVFDNDDTLITNTGYDKIPLIVENIISIICAFAKHPFITYALIKDELFDESPASAEEWREIFKNLNDRSSHEYRFARFIQQWIERKIIISGMDTLVKELYGAGYSISLWTNMGTHDGAFFEKKFESLYKFFIFRLYVLYKEGIPIIKKPSKKSVEQFMTLHKKINHNSKTPILIDDNLKNCLAARKFGDCDYIHFKNSKQLRTILRSKKAF